MKTATKEVKSKNAEEFEKLKQLHILYRELYGADADYDGCLVGCDESAVHLTPRAFNRFIPFGTEITATRHDQKYLRMDAVVDGLKIYALID